MILIAKQSLCRTLDALRGFDAFPVEDAPSWHGTFLSRVKQGESFVFIGNHGLELLESLWIFAAGEGRASLFPADSELRGAFPEEASCRYVCLRPPNRYTLHGLHEEPVAELIPLAEARDAFGGLLGYPAVLIRNNAPALVSGHYRGGHWYVLAAEGLESCPTDRLTAMLTGFRRQAEEGCFVSSFLPEFALYEAHERVRLQLGIVNGSSRVRGLRAELRLRGEKGTAELIGERYVAVNPQETAQLCLYWYPRDQAGLCRLEVLLYEQDMELYGLARLQGERELSRGECAVLIAPGRVETLVEVRGREITVNGDGGFLVGTHYYPSSSFFDLSYRPLRLKQAMADVEAMRRAGVRLVRIWCDPWLDETSLRAMRALCQLFGSAGMGVIMTIYNSWVRTMGVSLPEESFTLQVSDDRDDALIGLYGLEMEGQKRFVQSLAKGMAGLPNLIWDLSNEFLVVDPAPDQLDPVVFQGIRDAAPGPARSTEIFRRWAGVLRTAIIDTGSSQPIIGGVTCWDGGTDNYGCSLSMDITADHSYQPLQAAAPNALLSDPACLGRPLLLEEFGGCYPDMDSRAQAYGEYFHRFCGVGAAGALIYEWGVSWLIDRLPPTPPHLKYLESTDLNKLDGFYHRARYDYGRTFLPGSVGICPWAASFEYGSNWGCTGAPSAATGMMRYYARLGSLLTEPVSDPSVILLLPLEHAPFFQGAGYVRHTEEIFQTAELLWSRGVAFTVWQEDRADTLPESARVILFPCRGELSGAIQAALGRARARGASVYLGCDDPSGDPLLAPRFQGGEGACLMRRGQRGGEALFFLGEGNQTFLLDDYGGAELDGSPCAALVFRDGQAVAADFSGTLRLKGQEVAHSGGSRVLLWGDGGFASSVHIYSPEEADITFARCYQKALALDDNGGPLGELRLSARGEGCVLRIPANKAGYTVRLEQ